MDQNQPISPCNGDAISASVRIIARSLQHRRVAWMHDFRDSPTRRSSHSTNPEVERRRPRRDTAPPNFRVFKVNQPVVSFRSWRLVFDTCFDTLPRRSFEGPCAFPDTSCGQVVATCPQYSALTVRTPAMHHTVRRPRPTVRPCRFATHRLSYRRAAAGHALWLPRQQG